MDAVAVTGVMVPLSWVGSDISSQEKTCGTKKNLHYKCALSGDGIISLSIRVSLTPENDLEYALGVATMLKRVHTDLSNIHQSAPN